VLLFNVGLNHHVGPHRLNVDLARHLAGLGFASLRFDLSGLGDSEARPDPRPDHERAAVDVVEAMDFLSERRGIERFVIIALCSGVDPAHAVAVRDGRVTGAVFIDGYAYVTRGWAVRDRLEQLRRRLAPTGYSRWLRRHLWPRLGGLGRPEVGAAPIFDRTFPPLTRFTEDLSGMSARGARLFFLYTRHAYFFNHRGQFATMIGRHPLPEGIEVEHWPALDHVLTPVGGRDRAIRRIGAWTAGHFGESGVASTCPRVGPSRAAVLTVPADDSRDPG
jgi:hypothetical protein